MECIYLPDIWNLRSNQDINNFRFPTQILFLLWRIPPCVDINIPSPWIRFSHAQSQVAGPGPGKPVYGGQCNGVPLPDMNYEAIKREIVPILHNNHSMARHFLTEEKRYTVQSTEVQFVIGAGSLDKAARTEYYTRYYHQAISMLKVVPC